MHRSRARWPTRSVDHPTDTALSSRYRAGGRAKSDTLHERRAVGAFPAADTACTAAALGGQREALTTLPIPRCPAATEPEDEPVPLRCTNRRAVGAFPGRRYGMHRSRARWPTRSVDHPCISTTALHWAIVPD